MSVDYEQLTDVPSFRDQCLTKQKLLQPESMSHTGEGWLWPMIDWHYWFTKLTLSICTSQVEVFLWNVTGQDCCPKSWKCLLVCWFSFNTILLQCILHTVRYISLNSIFIMSLCSLRIYNGNRIPTTLRLLIITGKFNKYWVQSLYQSLKIQKWVRNGIYPHIFTVCKGKMDWLLHRGGSCFANICITPSS